MTTCPKCGRPVSGRARACGYCGESLVQDYFSQDTPPRTGEPAPVGIAALVGLVLGIAGGLALTGALVFQILALFGFGPENLIPETDLRWWLRTLVMALPPVVFLMQQLLLRGTRTGMLSDCIWLFLSTCGLMLTVQLYMDRHARGFYGMNSIPYLLVLGCTLAAACCIANILAFRKPS